MATCISYGILWVFHQIGATLLDKDEYPYNFVFFMPGVVIVIVCAILSFGILINNPIARWGLAIIDGLALLISLYKRKSVW